MYECSLDGSPFEPCLSPKPYGNLAPEISHIFKVRAKGILGNTDKTPDVFTINTITSSVVEGVFRSEDQIVANTPISIDKTGNKTTDSRGGFFFEGIGIGTHLLELSIGDIPHYILFPVPPGTYLKDLGTIWVRNLSEIQATGTSLITNLTEDEIKFIPMPNLTDIPTPITPLITNLTEDDIINITIAETRGFDSKVTLLQEGKKINNNRYLAKVLLAGPDDALRNIKNVSYHLHPTFIPSVINSTTPENRFAISFTGWGVFDLRARIYFNDDQTLDLALPSTDWKFDT